MPRYAYDAARDCIIDKETGKRADYDPKAKPEVPYVRGDLPAYFSVASGKWVDGRAARKEDLKRTGCVPWEPDSKRYDPKGFGNPRFAAKHGLKLSEEALHRKRPQRLDPFADLNKD